jgi:hypothetical protein
MAGAEGVDDTVVGDRPGGDLGCGLDGAGLGLGDLLDDPDCGTDPRWHVREPPGVRWRVYV